MKSWCTFLLAWCIVTAALAVESTAWVKYENNPVLGGDYGTCFDVCVLQEEQTYRMWFSWRPKASIALSESADGIHWSKPVVVLGPRKETGWEDDLNRPVVIKRGREYQMWYTGQVKGRSAIGLATSPDGVTWKRAADKPVLTPELPWEKVAVMCPHVLYDEQSPNQPYRMWYSGGEQNEPNAIGYATSADGLRWNKCQGNPIFRPAEKTEWERHKVTACQVIRQGDWHVMFYIGFRNEATAQIGLARSRDGVTDWQRHPANPIVPVGGGKTWDRDACYKPFAIFDGQRWLLWYNGRQGPTEQIGLVTHAGADLGFDAPAKQESRSVLPPTKLRRYVEAFNQQDEELYPQQISNAQAGQFLEENIPWFDCPDPVLEQTYYFRWWTYRKHLKQTPDGTVITEFLPKVSWAGKHNTINCAAGHHLYEGRWLREPKYLDEYSLFWFRSGGAPRRYSFWAADAILARARVTGNLSFAQKLLPDLVQNYEAWEKTHLDPNGLFWQIDDRDGMEVSIGGSGYRATINSYMYGDARAISALAKLAGQVDLADRFAAKARDLKRQVQEKLWDADAQFFKVLPRKEPATLAGVRELHGYTPWYFQLPDPSYAVAWKQLTDPQGFAAPFGPTTAEQRHPKFALSYQGHECQWNGPSWPYATSITLTALANLLNEPNQQTLTRRDYFELLRTYAKSHQRTRDDGTVIPWIDENLHPQTGDWISRTRLKTWKNNDWDAGKGGPERGKDYNHSTFCDLIISGLAGLRPRTDDVLEVNPLLPEGVWDYFCLDRIPYHGRNVTIRYDRTGQHYQCGVGLQILVDGEPVAAAEKLTHITVNLPKK